MNRGLLSAGLLAVLTISLRADDPRAAQPHPALEKLSRLAGGTWRNVDPDGKPGKVEVRWEWDPTGKMLKSSGVLGTGTKTEQHVSAFIGWDPVRKQVFYLDVHGAHTAYSGTVELEGDKLVFQFDTIVGKPARWKSVEHFPDENTLQFTFYSHKDGSWVEGPTMTMKRAR